MKVVIIPAEVFEAEFAHMLETLSLSRAMAEQQAKDGAQAPNVVNDLHRKMHYELVRLKEKLEDSHV